MHIAMLYITRDDAPVSGYALYVVCDETDRTIKVLHPVTLQSVDITYAEYRAAKEQELWPNAYDLKVHRTKEGVLLNEAVCRIIEKNVNAGKTFSSMLIRRVLASLRDMKLEDVPLLKGSQDMSSAAPRGFAVKSEKRPGIIDAISSMLSKEGGVTVDEALEELCRLFPDRGSDGMKTTIRCQINRLPGKLGRKLESRFDEDRGGKVFNWGTV